MFFLAQPKDSGFELKSQTKMTLSDRLFIWFEECEVRIYISAVNGCQSEVLFVRKFKIDCEGIIIGYDIEIIIPILFYLQLGHVYKEGSTSFIAS